MERAGPPVELSATPGSGAAPSAQPRSAGKERGVAPRVLVVEDDPADLATVYAVLNDAGYHVHPASNASLALRFLASSTPDLILMDVGLPDKSGFELCLAVKSRDEIAEELGERLAEYAHEYCYEAILRLVRPPNAGTAVDAPN
jgi:PleD family two-component response regulator